MPGTRKTREISLADSHPETQFTGLFFNNQDLVLSGLGREARLAASTRTTGVRISPARSTLFLALSYQGESAPLLTENEVGSIPTVPANEGLHQG